MPFELEETLDQLPPPLPPWKGMKRHLLCHFVNGQRQHCIEVGPFRIFSVLDVIRYVEKYRLDDDPDGLTVAYQVWPAMETQINSLLLKHGFGV